MPPPCRPGARRASPPPMPRSLHFVLSPGRLPRGRRVYAIGDIHGCLAELRTLHAAIEDDLARRPSASAILLHLGDYIDFGPDSAGVIELLAAGPPIAGLPMINLMGDHERTALDALSGDGAAATDWLHLGGQAALDSWGIPVGTPRGEWRSLIPVAHVAFLQALCDRPSRRRLSVRARRHPTGRGARPSGGGRQARHPTKLPGQRAGLRRHRGARPFRQPRRRPCRPNRIGIDTGAGNGGKLTCAVFEDDAVAFMSA